MDNTPHYTDIGQFNKKEMGSIWREFKYQAAILGVVLGIMWVLVGVDYFWDGVQFANYGIDPRTMEGLPAVFYAHFLHTNPLHLLVNMTPFVILGWLVMFRDTRDFFAVSFMTILAAGGAVWLFGNDVTRVGSGALICGYLGCLLSWGIFERSITSILVSVGVGILYFGILLSVLNPFAHHSWVGCVAALLTGAFVARFMTRHFRSHLTNSITDKA